MIYKLTLDVSIEEFKILREAVSSYRAEVFDDECCDGDVYPGGHPTEHYDQVDRVYHLLESFKNGL